MFIILHGPPKQIETDIPVISTVGLEQLPSGPALFMDSQCEFVFSPEETLQYFAEAMNTHPQYVCAYADIAVNGQPFYNMSYNQFAVRHITNSKIPLPFFARSADAIPFSPNMNSNEIISKFLSVSLGLHCADILFKLGG